MYKFKSIARRGTALSAALAILVAAIMPSVVFADALNPLTERSLLLSSSAPGFQNTDGSGNPTYAPPGSGPNGQKTGETFKFKMSSTATIEGITLQYCTEAAGKCQAPGDNTGDARDDLPSAREDNATAHPLGRSDLDVVGTFAEGAGAGAFQVIKNGTPETGWAMTSINAEDTSHTGNLTGKKNMMRLVNGTGTPIVTNDIIELVFRASPSNYITNPGSGAFFVKINTYNTDDTSEFIPTVAYEDNDSIVDGGVTVANVMTDSIHITTKVLETMAFSVGTRNRDNQTLNCGVDFGEDTQPDGCEAASGATHGTCDPIQQVNNNQLQLGNPNAEFSLETDTAYDVSSYWRLSSNSSGGATVYYSGNTLANTVGDEIAEVPTETISTPGTEQFGLGFVDAGLDTESTAYTALIGSQPARYKEARSFPFITVKDQDLNAPYDTLTGQTASNDYDEATGTIDNGIGGAGTAKFKFLKSSLTVPEPIAQQDDDVISCATAKMRYVANIGADTPAGVYTTKVNYLAAPQY